MSIKMVDITLKPTSYRVAVAEGKIKLKKETIKLIVERKIEKGDVLTAAKLAGILAAKEVPRMIPLCHPIPLTHVDITFEVNVKDCFIKVISEVKAQAKTGVEIEALMATLIALLTIWDMVKKYEKDSKGMYPETKIYDVKVVLKKKEPL